MEKAKELNVSYGSVTEKNIELVRTLNLAIFPVTYASGFYQTLPSYNKYSRLGKQLFM